MKITLIAGVVTGVLKLIGFIPYIISVIRGKTKPSRASWFVWTVLTIILSFSYWQSGARATFVVPFVALIATVIVALLSIKYGEGGWTSFDKKCLVASGFGLFLWWIFKEPVLATLSALIVNIIGAFPTIKKVWSHPESEDKVSWAIFISSSIVNVFAIDTLKFSIIIYPILLLLTDSSIALPVLFKKRNEGLN